MSGTYGDSTPAGTVGAYTDTLYTLTGTQVNGIATSMTALAMRVHRKASQGAATPPNVFEMWYLDTSNATWYLLPAQPLIGKDRHPQLAQVYRQPGTLECTFLDSWDGLLTPENLNSAYNVNHGGFPDALLDEARKVLFRAGCWCWFNAAAGIAPTLSAGSSGASIGTGLLSWLTDGKLGQLLTSTANYVQMSVTAAQPFTLFLDLASVQTVHHAVIRFASQEEGSVCTLPASIAVQTSADNVTWTSWPAHSAGGDGTGSGGVWTDDLLGSTMEFAFTDLDTSARYVRFIVTPTGAQTLFLDELAVYADGQGGSTLGKNWFVGYLGDATQVSPEGLVTFRATDVLRRLNDNNSVRITKTYHNMELADILYALLTDASYWVGSGTSYSAPVSSSFIGWSSGHNVTGFTVPVWQGQNNSLLGYAYELIPMIGWVLAPDGKGVLQLYEPTYTAVVPDRVFVAGPDGNNDVRECVRRRDGKDIRNVISVAPAAPKGNAVLQTYSDVGSVSRYGARQLNVTDPIATEAKLQGQIARMILRDYSRRVQGLVNVIQTDADTKIRGVYGFQAPARPALFAKASSVPGSKRSRELWSLMQVTEHFTAGQWYGEGVYIPYTTQPPDPPSHFSVYPNLGVGTAVASWDTITSPTAASVNLYISSTSGASGFNAWASGISIGPPYTITGLTPGSTYWAYITVVDIFGSESLSSNTVKFVAGTHTLYDWGPFVIADLAATFNSVQGPFAGGIYTYEFKVTFTAPPGGLPSLMLRWSNVASPPGAVVYDGWWIGANGYMVYTPPIAAGTAMTYYFRIRGDTNLSGTSVYIVAFVSDRPSLSHLENWYQNNPAPVAVSIP